LQTGHKIAGIFEKLKKKKAIEKRLENESHILYESTKYFLLIGFDQFLL